MYVHRHSAFIVNFYRTVTVAMASSLMCVVVGNFGVEHAFFHLIHILHRGIRGRDRMLVGFIASCAFSVYHIVSSNSAHAKCTRYNIM